MATEIFTIEARSLNIFGFGSHDFWVLKDSSGNLIAALNGAAYNRNTNEVDSIGYTTHHSLRVFQTAR